MSTYAATTAPEMTREDITKLVAEFLASPEGWPAAMAARGARLRAGHPAYSPNNQTAILCQLYSRAASVLGDDAGDDAHFAWALDAAQEETAPASVWRSRGFQPAGPGLSIWSRPIAIYTDADGKRAYSPAKLPGGESSVTGTYRAFTIERTYLARDVRNADGEDGRAAFAAPDLEPGHAREVFARLAGWIGGQGWTVTRTGRDSAENGSTVHAARSIRVHGGLTDWAAVETLAHEIAHALLHGADDDRPYAGEHRGDMEAEAESVAFGLLVAFGQTDLARGAARYAAEWTRDAARVAVAYERACHVTDALVRVAMGEDDVTVAESAKAAKLAAKTSNRELAAKLRDAGVEPTGEAWRLAKAGAPMADVLAVAGAR